MSGQDLHLLIPAGDARTVQMPGEFIYAKSVHGKIHVIIDGKRVEMESGDKARLPKAFKEFMVENRQGTDQAVTLVVGFGDYNRQIVQGEVSIVPGLRRQSGIWQYDGRGWLSATLWPHPAGGATVSRGERVSYMTFSPMIWSKYSKWYSAGENKIVCIRNDLKILVLDRDGRVSTYTLGSVSGDVVAGYHVFSRDGGASFEQIARRSDGAAVLLRGAPDASGRVDFFEVGAFSGGTIPYQYDCANIDQAAARAYMKDPNNGDMWLFDLNTMQMVQVAGYFEDNNSFCVHSNLLYWNLDNGTWRVYDVTDPQAPTSDAMPGTIDDADWLSAVYDDVIVIARMSGGKDYTTGIDLIETRDASYVPYEIVIGSECKRLTRPAYNPFKRPDGLALEVRDGRATLTGNIVSHLLTRVLADYGKTLPPDYLDYVFAIRGPGVELETGYMSFAAAGVPDEFSVPGGASVSLYVDWNILGVN